MENILNASAPSKGVGLKRTIYFGLVADIETWPELTSPATTYEDLATLNSVVVMKSTKQMYSFEATVRKSSFNTMSAGQRGAKSAKNRLEIVQVVTSPALVGFLAKHQNDEMFFIINDLAGQARFIGDEDLPATCEEYELPSGADNGDEVDCKIVFEAVGAISQYYGTLALPLAIPLTPAL